MTIGDKPDNFTRPPIIVIASDRTAHDHGCTRFVCITDYCTNREQRTLWRLVVAMVALY